MDVRNGDLYLDLQAALDAGVPAESAVEVRGTEEAIKALSLAIAEREAAAREEAAKRLAEPVSNDCG